MSEAYKPSAGEMERIMMFRDGMKVLSEMFFPGAPTLCFVATAGALDGNAAQYLVVSNMTGEELKKTAEHVGGPVRDRTLESEAKEKEAGK